MATIKFAIRDKETGELLNSQQTVEHWDDGGANVTETQYTVERDGDHGTWFTDCGVTALFVKEGIIKEQFIDSYPVLVAKGDFEVVAIHEMQIGSDATFSVMTTENVTQSLEEFLTDDAILRAKSTYMGGTFDEYRYECYKAKLADENEKREVLRIDITTAIHLIRMFKKENVVQMPHADEMMLINQLILSADQYR